MAVLAKFEKAKAWVVANLAMAVFWGLMMPACSDQVTDLVGPSFSGYVLGVKAFYGSAGLPADGTSQATIRIEVTDTAGRPVSTTALVTTTLGTLETSSVTVTNGVGTTTLTSSSTAGNAYIVVTVENITATTFIPIVIL